MRSFVCLGLFFLLLAVFSSLLSPALCAKWRCHPNDHSALMKIKKSLNNPYLTIDWLPKTDCCDWGTSVECDEVTNRVISVDLSNDQIPGQIPDAFCELPYLNTIILHKLVNLTGPIPESFTKLHNLKTLWLSWNNISGPVPEFLSQLHNLEYLNLAFNKFTGSVPASLSKLTKLDALHLDRNMLTGPIPESYGHFTGSVPDLYLSHNHLSGPIPKSLGRLNFVRIDLSRNKLPGDASMLFGSRKTTETMDLSRNLLEFDFSKVRFSKKLIYLDLNHDKIYGSLPKQMAKLDLQTLNVSYNRLCGTIPRGKSLQRHGPTAYFHNKCLCGAPLGDC